VQNADMTDAPGPDPSLPPIDAAASAGALSDAQKSLRAQMLATEHWSLLASRSTTQSEVLTRIAIFLTLVSAGLVTLSVLGNVTGFQGWFGVAALGVLLLLVVLGLITQMRTFNASLDDLMYVIAMNRLRGAYLDLDPGIAPYLVSSANDDETGVHRTYYAFTPRNGQILASSAMIISVVEAAVLGLFLGGIVLALAGPIWLAVTLGVIGGLGWIAAWMVIGYRQSVTVFRPHSPLRTSPRD
jgi:CHASE2 domain-containing sensor protein